MKKSGTGESLAIGMGVLSALWLLGGTRTVQGGHDTDQEGLAAIRPGAIRADMRFLADDLLEGRATSTRGHEIAARFISSEFEAMGLEPVGDNGTYFQSVPLRSIRPDRAGSSLSIVQGEKGQALIFGQDFVTTGDPGRTDTSVEADRAAFPKLKS